MTTEEKENRLQNMLNIMTENKLKEICFEAFLDGLDKGLKIKTLKAEDEKQSA